MISLDVKTPSDYMAQIAHREAARRKELGYTQADVAKGAGMSLSSLRRFEQKHEIAFSSLVKIALFLGMEDPLDELFARKAYRSIDEVIAESSRRKEAGK